TGFVLTYLLIYQHTFNQTTNNSIEGSVANIGSQLLSTSEHGYVLPFEVVSILLLAAMIGCIVIAIKARPEIK
ncbi:MAG: NADH-quinone oxidoreductase subunit J, partial [Bacteroidota bacterium]